MEIMTTTRKTVNLRESDSEMIWGESVGVEKVPANFMTRKLSGLQRTLRMRSLLYTSAGET